MSETIPTQVELKEGEWYLVRMKGKFMQVPFNDNGDNNFEFAQYKAGKLYKQDSDECLKVKYIDTVIRKVNL